MIDMVNKYRVEISELLPQITDETFLHEILVMMVVHLGENGGLKDEKH